MALIHASKLPHRCSANPKPAQYCENLFCGLLHLKHARYGGTIVSSDVGLVAAHEAGSGSPGDGNAFKRVQGFVKRSLHVTKRDNSQRVTGTVSFWSTTTLAPLSAGWLKRTSRLGNYLGGSRDNTGILVYAPSEHVSCSLGNGRCRVVIVIKIGPTKAPTTTVCLDLVGSTCDDPGYGQANAATGSESSCNP
ncbi:hypothetical protein COCMIDRAFT_29964 [Bipolaris oryzae ATCC 44560]|uniref:Uncharacterized protein n=1 Tax=Bipolaris oryzae ATCC 44560 TaxID=930090 RepID=W6YUJ2_COCMI|nr:uncharacterized protein COCMIDRAFT_29964 [Bipolaris oryzae ATCC 44560]EUC41205.1 hypothetical protein COCMIDRAFT_29964 [Bipolaris oryzae ATCC 44560]